MGRALEGRWICGAGTGERRGSGERPQGKGYEGLGAKLKLSKLKLRRSPSKDKLLERLRLVRLRITTKQGDNEQQQK